MRLVVLALMATVSVVAFKSEGHATEVAPAPAAEAATPPADLQAQPPAQTGQGRLRTETTLYPANLTYRVTLVDGTSAKFAAGEGSFTEKSALGCDGWNIEQRLYVKFVPPLPRNGMQPIPVYLRTGSNIFESRDGLRYRFEDKSNMGGQMIASHKGEATLTAVGQEGVATYSDPAGQTIKLPAGTIFPTAFSYQLIKAAGAGHTSFSSRVFDGSMGIESGVLKLTADIGLPRAASYNPVRGGGVDAPEDFNTKLAWPVRLTVRPGTSIDARPLFQQGFSVLPNGRSETMLMDFGQFKLRFELSSYEPLPIPRCP